KDNYDAQIGTWVSSVFTALSMTESTFELIDETPEGDDEYTSISFTRVYREVIFNESSGSLNVPAIKNAVATFARSYVTEGGRSDIGATYVNITYSCLVDKTDGTYGSASAMSTLWKNVIRPHLLTQAKSLWGGTSSIIEDDNTTLDPTSRTIQSNMKILVSTKSNILEYQDVVELNRTAQRNYHKLLDGKDDTYNWHEPGRMLKATQTITVRTLSGLPVSPDILDGTFDSIDLLLDAPSGGFFNLDDENIRLEKLNKGLSPDSGGNVSSGYATVFTRMYTYLAPESKQVITGSGLRRFQRRT
ncbi:MAG: hypothetical protein KDD43_00185, partial [Bdellovibrionales bacterium]|nr:hypothetical protein [Bdellovibrionales bacterium]